VTDLTARGTNAKRPAATPIPSQACGGFRRQLSPQAGIHPAEHGKNTIVDFYADWVRPVPGASAGFGKDRGRQFSITLQKVNIDKQPLAKGTTSRHPALIVYDKQGARWTPSSALTSHACEKQSPTPRGR